MRQDTRQDSTLGTILAARIREGEPGALEEFYALLNRRVRPFLRLRFGPRDIDDRIHDCYIRTVTAVRAGELREPSRLLQYATGVARFQSITANRRWVDDIPLDDRRTGGRETNAEARLIAGEARAAARSLIGMMKPRDREILTRFYIREQSAEQICAAMELTGMVFRNAKTRAKARLAVMARQLRLTA